MVSVPQERKQAQLTGMTAENSESPFSPLQPLNTFTKQFHCSAKHFS